MWEEFDDARSVRGAAAKLPIPRFLLCGYHFPRGRTTLHRWLLWRSCLQRLVSKCCSKNAPKSSTQDVGMLTYVVCRVRLAVKPTKAGARFVRSTTFSDIFHGENDKPKTVIIMTLNIYGRSENKNKQMQHMAYLVVMHVHHGVCLASAQLESTV